MSTLSTLNKLSRRKTGIEKAIRDRASTPKQTVFDVGDRIEIHGKIINGQQVVLVLPKNGR